MAKRGAWANVQPAPRSSSSGSRKPLYTLEAVLISGPVSEEFVEANPVISRTIQILGSQTLEDLHYAIFKAFDREEEHMYEFQLGKEPMDRKARCYVLPMASKPLFGRGPKVAGKVDRTTIDSLGLAVKQCFFYWFDFGDDWWHEIKVLAIDEGGSRGKFPRVLSRVGDSPPQYPNWDDEDDEDDEEDDLDEDGDEVEAE